MSKSRLVFLPVFATCLVAGLDPVAAQNQTLLFTSRYDSESLDSGAGLLAKARPFDIFAVTPGANATAFPYLPAAATSAMTGDPDQDGRVAEFTGLPHNATGFGGMFIKHRDRKVGDPSLVFRTVLQPAQPTVTIQGFDGTQVHTIRPGDFVRWTGNGDLEFFIRQEHIMTAAGSQTVGIPGASALCQTAAGDLIYAPARDLAGQGGHHISNPFRMWCNDGSFLMIPAAAITYDAAGNVTSVVPDSTVQLAEEVSGGPNGQSSVRGMCLNSGALDSLGKPTTVTFTLIGLDIDPNGGTWDSNYVRNVPNLIFVFNNTADACCGGPWGSWHGTVFSTARHTNGSLGTVAKVNGVELGATSGTGDGKWTGLKQGSGHVSAPVLRGLAWIEAGFVPTAAYGNMALQTLNDGSVDLGGSLELAVQGPVGGFPTVLALSLGVAPGGRPLGIPFAAIWDGFGSVYAVPPFLLTIGLGSQVNGQSGLKDVVPNDPNLKGQNIVWQAVGVTFGRAMLSNPVVTEVR